MLTANAKYGGPIAITSHPDHILMTSDSNNVAIQNVCIFRNNGQLTHQIPKTDWGSKIVGFDFLEDEQLFILLQSGKYFFLDTHKGKLLQYDLGGKYQNEPIMEAKVVENSVVFYTNRKDVINFFYIKNIIESNKVFPFTHQEIRTTFLFFCPVSPKATLSEKLECQVTHPIAGIIRLVEDEPDCVFYNYNPNYTKNMEILTRLPEIKSIKLIAISPTHEVDRKLTAYFTEANTLYIVSSNYSDSVLYKTEVKIDTQEKQDHKKHLTLLWCAEDAVILIYGKQYQIITRSNGVVTKKMNTKGIVGYQEVDGVKIISNQKCEILRKLPKYYTNVFQINSKAKGIDLYYASNEFENREASYQNTIIGDKKGLQEGVEDCMSSACFEINLDEQIKLLKASHFGKTFLTSTNSKFDHDSFAYACKTLRVVNSLRNEGIARAITYDQFINIDPPHLIKILLRYQLYYLADEICKYLNYGPKLTLNIYVSWACSKIEGRESEDYLASVIHDKFEKLKNEQKVSISFTEISKKASFIGKKKLALKLLEKEPSIKKKVPVLLWMENYEDALKEAIKSRDPDLIYEVIFKMMKLQIDNKLIYGLIGKSAIARPYLVFYMKNFEPELLDDYYLNHTASNEEKGLYFIQKAYQTKDLMKRFTLVKEVALKHLAKERFYEDATKDYTELMNKMTQDTRVKIAEEKSLKQYVELYLSLNDIDTAEKLKKQFKMSDKSYIISRLKGYADQGQWVEFEALVADKNKRSAVVPYYAIVEMLVDYKENDRADKYVMKLPDIDDQIITFKMMGKIKQLIDVAFQSKKYKYVEEWENNPNLDPKLKQYIDDTYIRLGKKR
jgi:hypothetical protein